MGEAPIYTCKAHVFIIDPATKSSWIPMSKAAAVINFFFDSSRKSYRIISVERSKAIINSTVTEGMTFNKTAAKFGQWADVRANTVYGLGFASDVELTKFQEQFCHICERVKELGESDAARGAIDDISNGINEQHLGDQIENHDTFLGKGCEEEMFSSASDENRYNFHLSELKSLQSQNDKLKNILAHSSAHVKKSETELQALKNTNTRLTTALQESIANADHWQKQIAMYREENERYKRRVADLESDRSKDMEYGERVVEMRREVEQLQKDYSEKCQECNMLQQRVGVLAVIERQHNECAAKIKKSYTEVSQLKVKISSLEETISQMAKEKNAKQLDGQQQLSKLSNLLTEITTVAQKLQSTL